MPLLLDSAGVDRILGALADQISADASREHPIAIVGVRRRGETLARRLLPLLQARGAAATHYGALDITLYRDDLSEYDQHAQVRGTEIDFDITGAWLVLVDDVLYTGRSIAAALRALHALGRPRLIRLAVLVDRGHRELPLHADFVGLHTPTQEYHIVKVKVREIDGLDEVELVDTRNS